MTLEPVEPAVPIDAGIPGESLPILLTADHVDWAIIRDGRDLWIYKRNELGDAELRADIGVIVAGLNIGRIQWAPAIPSDGAGNG